MTSSFERQGNLSGEHLIQQLFWFTVVHISLKHRSLSGPMATAGLGTSNRMGLFALSTFSQTFIISFSPNNAQRSWEKSANNNLIPTPHLQVRSLLRAAPAELALQVPLQLHPQQSSSRGPRHGSDLEPHAETRGIKQQILPIYFSP